VGARAGCRRIATPLAERLVERGCHPTASVAGRRSSTRVGKPRYYGAMLRSGDRHKLERALAARERAEQHLLGVVRELRKKDASVTEIAEAIGYSRYGIYKMLERAEHHD
jgi:hypothetical protein